MTKLLKFLWHHIVPEEIYSKILFRRFWKYWMNLDNPKTFGEKLHWIKLRGEKFIESKYVDKFLVRDFVAKTIGEEYLINLLRVYEHERDIKYSDLPNTPFIIKTNHDSGIGFIFHNKEDHDLNMVRKILGKRLKINHYYKTKEYPYKEVKPKILIESLLLNQNKEIPNDIKIYCFHGEPQLVYCSLDRLGEDYRVILDKDLNPISMSWGKNPEKFKNKRIDPPRRINEMFNLARKLSAKLPLVRIDLYDQDDQIFFGEMTFFQGSGFDPIFPLEADKKLGSLLDITRINRRSF
jgi:hypothetical protein